MSKWKVDELLAEKRSDVAKVTASWSAEELREQIAQLLAATYPFEATLSPLLDCSMYDGAWVSSDLFPHHMSEVEPHDYSSTWGVRYEGDSKWSAVDVDYAKPLPPKLADENNDLPKNGVHDSFDILSTHASYSIAGIFCGSFSTDDVRRLVDARHFGPTPPSQKAQP